MATITNVLEDLRQAQNSDHDGRERAREADHFVNKKDGQWEPHIISQYANKPRYTFDKVSSVVADICGEMNSMDFNCKVRPSGGPATTQIALHYDGIIRNIQNNSGVGAKYIYRAAARQMVTTGLGGWQIVADYREPTSYQQDLIIKPISNFMDRVWFEPGAEERDMSDAQWGFLLTSMTLAAYNGDFPKGSQMSIARDNVDNVYYFKKPAEVIVGTYYKRTAKKSDLVLMSNDAVYLVDDKFDQVKDELAAQDVTVVDSRETKIFTVKHRMFDGKDWLTDSAETVFDYVPLVPTFANYELSEDKVIYWGAVEKAMDAQRVLNYAESRKIEEGALAPRAKKWMTNEQIAGHEATLQTLNSNTDPVQAYNHIADQPQPFETGGAQINAGLAETAQAMGQHILSIANKMDPSRDGARGLQSGVALQAVQNKADNSNFEYFIAMEIPIAHTCRILINAIPKIYDAKQEMRIDMIDDTTKTITINDPILDTQTGKIVNMNDLSAGSYSVTCSAGPAFHNRQEETVNSLTEIAKIDPSILQLGSDIMLNNIPAPGMDKLAARKRAMMLQQGVIPPEEWTDEEKQKMQQQQQQQGQQGPTPEQQAMIIAAQAEEKKAQADLQTAQAKIQELQIKMSKIQQDTQTKHMEMAAKAQHEQAKLEIDKFKAETDRLKASAVVRESGANIENMQATQATSRIEASAKLVDSFTQQGA